MTVKEIVHQWLKKNNYDGLYSDNPGCRYGCGIDELFPCAGINGWNFGENCKSAYKYKETNEDSEFCREYLYGPNKKHD